MVFSTGLFVGVFIGILMGAALTFTAVLLGERVAHGDQQVAAKLDHGPDIGRLTAEPEPTPEETTGVIPVVTDDDVNPWQPPPQESGRHRATSVPVRDYGEEVRVWPAGDPDTQVLVPVREEVQA
ncbi:MAG: hypothetical protein WBA97_34355 [Actinophytocola sp.]|uniref:hypothetical protein n=1 Tax=Actinophytocola sp. TaxID=1872138 RepID=UPI003C774BDF